ncbi:MAG: vWA domain-containing protein [Gemmataceae bacterium]
MATRPGSLLRMWFPFALVAMAFAALPGAILFALNLFGWEGEVNHWLETRLNLSYHIPIPWWGALLLFLMPPLLILLYFLKLKRKPIQVPSTFLWKKSIEDLHVNSLFQWLRNNVLLLLQLLVLLALIYGILAPRIHGAGGVGKHYILMIDNSASMSATDVSPSRLEWAKAEAVKEIDAAGDNDFGMIIVFNSRAEVLQSYTSNRAVLRQRVMDIEPTQRTTHIEDALNLADSLANPKVSAENEAVKPADSEPGKERTYVAPEGLQAEVHLYSDGRFPDVPEFALGNLDLRYHPAGVSGDNVAIVDFNAVRDETDKNLIQVFSRMLNYGPAEVSTKFELEVRVEGQLKKRFEKAVTIPPFGRQKGEGDNTTALEKPGERSLTFDVSDLDDQTEVVLHANLAGLQDNFALDNSAWLVVGVVRKARVLVISSGNSFLRALFDDEATRTIADVTWLSPEEFAKPEDRRKKYLDPARNGAFDLVVFDNCAPDSEDEMPRANTFFIGRPAPPMKFDPAKKADRLYVKGWVTQSPLLRYLTSLHEIGATVTYKLDDLPPKTPRLMEAEGNVAMMVSLTRGAYTDVVQAFPLVREGGVPNTNWPLQPSFPIFWRNVLYVLGNVSDAAGEDVLQPGNPKRLRPPGRVDRVSVTAPDGKTTDLERVGSRSDFDYQATERVGVYQAEWAGGGRSFAVNLLDADESNLQPRQTIQIGSEKVVGGETRSQSRELWKWAVLAALLFLLLEWYVYNKRVYV